MDTESFYVTKYWLTSGAERWNLEPDANNEYASDPESYAFFKIGRDAFRTWAEALSALETARAKKAKSLRKQVAEIEAMQFVEPPAP